MTSVSDSSRPPKRIRSLFPIRSTTYNPRDGPYNMSTELLQKLREAEVIPQVIPEDQANSIKSAVKVVYPNTTISLGEKPLRRDVLEIPEIEFPEAVSSFTSERRHLYVGSRISSLFGPPATGSLGILHDHLHRSRPPHERGTNRRTRE